MTDSEASQADWRRTRRLMTEQRVDLAHAAAADHPDLRVIGATDLLARPEWLPTKPIALDDLALDWRPDVAFGGLTGREELTENVRPYRTSGVRYETYADAIGDLVRPPIFENRTLYRLLEANLRDTATLAFGRGRYFDTINICEAAGHEYAGRYVPSLRNAIGDPTDTTRRCAGVGITTLTIRLDPDTNEATFLLHWRDPAKVVHAGGLYQVVPVGIFQPSNEAPGHESNDFDVWANIVREFHEELLGGSEDYGDDPIDYQAMPLYQRLAAGRRAGSVRPYVLGLGVDPLTFATDLLTVTIIDAPIFDDLFGATVDTNAEGEIVAGTPFTEQNVDRYAHHEPMQAAGAATLWLAWQAWHLSLNTR